MINMPVIDTNAPIGLTVEQVRKIYINDYEKLVNQPQINSVPLIGNQSSHELGLESELEVISQLDLYTIFHRALG